MSKTTIEETGFYGYLETKGISRRTFLKFCGGIAVSIGLAETMAPRVAQALEIGATSGNLAPVVWIEAGSCTGCTESVAQSENPNIAKIVLDLISLNYSETLSAGAGYSLEQAKDDTIEAGGYVLVYEGAVMTGWDGNALRVAGRKGTEILEEAARNAVAIIAAGSCAVDGGWQAGYPNPGGAMGVQEYLNKVGITDVPVINIPACPVNPANLVSVIVDYLFLKELPSLNSLGAPSSMFGQTVHDNCPRRGHFENGEFVYQFGSVEEKNQYCLYAMGCRGPQTYSNCALVRWNNRASWCVESGAPCCGCATAKPGTHSGNWVDNNTPFLAKRFRDINVGGFRFQPEIAAAGVTGVVAACIAIHAFGMKKTGRTHGAPIESIKDYDKKRDERAKKAKAEEMKNADANMQKSSQQKLDKQRAAKILQYDEMAIKNAENRNEPTGGDE